MAYTRQLKLTEDTETRLVNWLEQQLTNHYSERGPFIADLLSYQSDYWAKPPDTPNTFPFHNSANIIIPLTAIAFEAVHARSMMTLFALDQFVTVKLPEQFDELDSSLERYLDHVFLNSINIRKQMEPAIMEVGKFGTGVARTGYVDLRRTAVFENNDGEEEEVEVIIDKGPTIDSVPDSRFLMPMQSQDTQTAPWCGEEHVLTPFQVRQMEESGILAKGTTMKLSSWMLANNGARDSDSQQKYENDIDSMQNRTPVFPSELTFVEIWTDFSIDEKEIESAICVWYHRLSRTIVSCRYNWFRDLRRPYRHGNYIPLEFRWHGVGIAKQNDQFQKEVTTQHRQRIDNGTIANTMMFKVLRNSGISINEPIFPGKMWMVDSHEDIQVMPMADVKASSYNNENQATVFSQQRTGVNELTLGMPQVGTPGTATDSMARVQESARKFDYTHSNTRTFVRRIVQDTVLNLAQFGPRDVEIFEYLPRGPEIEDFFKNPVEYFKKFIIYEIHLVGQNSNRMLDRQSWTQITQMSEKYFQSKLALAQQSGDPALVQQITKEALASADELFKQSLEAFNLRNINRIIPSAGKSRTEQGTPVGPEIPSQIQGMGGAPQGIPTAPPQLPQGIGGLQLPPAGMYPTG